MLLISEHVVLGCKRNKTQHGTKHIRRDPLLSYASRMNSARQSVGAGWGTLTGEPSREPLARGYYPGSHLCFRCRLVLNVSSIVLLLSCADNVLCPTEPLDDVLTFLITIGSPPLAIYSLQITHLNARWVAKEFLDVKYPNSKRIPTVLSAFHHIPIKISHHPRRLHSLIILHNNDGFWEHLLKAVKQTRRWSIPLIMNFGFVIFAVILTIVDSAYTPSPGDVGYGIAATWTFLLPLLIGWLRVGCEPEPNHLRNSLDVANGNTRVATQRNTPEKGYPPIEFMEPKDVDPARRDELKTTPVFNYSRAFVSPLVAELILGLVKNAAANARQKIPVGNPTVRGPPAWVGDDGDTVLNQNRVGTADQVSEYCTKVFPELEPGSGSIIPLDTQLSEMTNTTNPLLPLHDPYSTSQVPSRWATGIWKRVALASALALGLQWGTTGGAVVIHYAAPPIGLGCRALSFLLYGAAGTVSFFFFLASSILAQMSRPYQGRKHTHPRLRPWQNAGAIICRWLGKGIALVSAIGILVVCVFQTTGAFNNCFCTSTTFDRGRESPMNPMINRVVGPSVFGAWIGGLAMAFGTAILFGFLMYLGKPPRR